MKAKNAVLQERAYWDTILGTYENTLRKLASKLNRELRAAHFPGRDELCREIGASCERPAEKLHHYRHMLGVISRT